MSAGSSRKDHEHPWARPSLCPPRTGFGPGGSDPSPIPWLPRVAGSKAMLEKAGSCCPRGSAPASPLPGVSFPPTQHPGGRLPGSLGRAICKIIKSPRQPRDYGR